ncbi:MAG: Mrp/NBP35 family ATP-binding protein [Methanothrix sp.]|uniref:Mrp/NBP35 family ATP-binding protein n=1 Tax=Methanothrix sp. TaxID=90426 RepID=UPI0025FBFABD|nr:Mrp/NBP35 family ATP-binding protein [Methanothrix sp.]MCQ8903663.1 Mrp/NBP35 family ATP-binding protein [Methanothrix sp.]
MQDRCDKACDRCDAQGSCTDEMRRMRRIRRKMLVGSGKGGVGKSTVAAYLAIWLAKRGYSVGLLDADITGPNIPKLLGIEDERLTVGDDGIHPATVGNIKVVSMALILPTSGTSVVWRGPMKMAAIKQFISDVCWGDLDYLIVDLPPGTSDEPISLVQLIPDLDGVVVVTTPQDVAILDTQKSVDMFRKMNVRIIGMIENMSGLVCPHCGERIDSFGSGNGAVSARDMGVEFLGSVPIDPELGMLYKYLDGTESSSPGLRSMEMIASKIARALD